jgi:hypothetical protein
MVSRFVDPTHGYGRSIDDMGGTMTLALVTNLLGAIWHGGAVPLLWVIGVVCLFAGVVGVIRGALLAGILLIIIGIVLGGLNVL